MGDRKNIGIAGYQLAELLAGQGARDEAVALGGQAVGLFREMANKHYVSRATSALGSIHCRLGEYPRAAELQREALALATEIGYVTGAGEAGLGLGIALARGGDTAGALPVLRQALRSFEQAGYRLGIANAHRELGQLLPRDTAEGGAHLDQAAAIYNELGLAQRREIPPA
jgi:tetratricopeptide (TPR) repeat protein